jgi:hypothetical protein
MSIDIEGVARFLENLVTKICGARTEEELWICGEDGDNIDSINSVKGLF